MIRARNPADLIFVPAQIRQIKRDESAEAGLNIGEKEIQPIEAPTALLRDGSAEHFAGIKEVAKPGQDRTPGRFEASSDRLF